MYLIGQNFSQYESKCVLIGALAMPAVHHGYALKANK